MSHGGAWGGYRAELLRFPDQHFSVTCLCNVASAGPTRRAHQVDNGLPRILGAVQVEELLGHGVAPFDVVGGVQDHHAVPLCADKVAARLKLPIDRVYEAKSRFLKRYREEARSLAEEAAAYVPLELA